MANMARIQDGIVTELLKSVDGFDIADCFHPDILAGCVPVEDEVQVGWIVTEDGLQAPEPAPEPETPTEEAPPA